MRLVCSELNLFIAGKVRNVVLVAAVAGLVAGDYFWSQAITSEIGNLICRQSPNSRIEGASCCHASKGFHLFSIIYSHVAVRNLICSENPQRLTRRLCGACGTYGTRLRGRLIGFAGPSSCWRMDCRRRTGILFAGKVRTGVLREPVAVLRTIDSLCFQSFTATQPCKILFAAKIRNSSQSAGVTRLTCPRQDFG